MQLKCLAANVLDVNEPVVWDGYRSLSTTETFGNVNLNGFDQKAVALSTTQDSYALSDGYLRNTSATAATLTLEGATQDYLATCAIRGALSIVWNPETSATQTVDGVKNHTMSGGITVSNGAFRIAGAATFAQVPSIEIADGAAFVCDATTAASLAGLANMSIGAGGRFVVGEGAAALEKLRHKIHPFILRRLKKDVAKDLPDKIVRIAYCSMSEEQQRLTNEVRQKAKAARTKFEMLAVLMRMRQIANHPELVEKGSHLTSGKLEAFFDILDEAMDGGHRVLKLQEKKSLVIDATVGATDEAVVSKLTFDDLRSVIGL